jgi:hypothetical protein
MKAGEYIEFEYIKDVSTHATNETCYFQALAITIRGEEDVTNSVARKVKNGYIGVNGVARKVTKGFVGVGGLARECFSEQTTWKKYNVIKNGTFVQNTVNVNGNYIGKIVTETDSVEATYSSVSIYTGVAKNYSIARTLIESEGYLLLTQE